MSRSDGRANSVRTELQFPRTLSAPAGRPDKTFIVPRSGRIRQAAPSPARYLVCLRAARQPTPPMPFRSSLDSAVNIDDLRRLARRRTPDVVFDYIDGGAEGEVTLRDNRRSWDEVLFRPRNAVRVLRCETATTVLGAGLSMPVLLAPVGYSRIF